MTLATTFVWGIGIAAPSEPDKTLSPYFLVTASEDEPGEQFPLELSSAKVRISGVIADVAVTQVYRNRGARPIEAVYVFPASTRAAIHAMKMTIGDRVVEARIEEKRTANATYEQAKREGKRSSLLEQERPNVFRMKVANILPGDRVEVELGYTELLIPEDGEYTFVYPTVVGPRYHGEANEGSSGANAWVSNPYLREGAPVPYRFDLTASIATGVPIQSLQSPSHPLSVDYKGPAAAVIQLQEPDQLGGNRDFVLNYRLEGKAIESGLLLHRGDTENYFLLMAQPPKRVQADQIPSREYIFIVDISGSMRGFPLDTSKRLMQELLSSLRPEDSFNILFFSGGSSMLAERSLPATRDNLHQAMAMMKRQRGGGGTRMLDAIQRAMSIPARPEISRSFVIITDGYVSVEPRVFDYVRRHLHDANFFAFGIGSSVNRFLIEGLARAGRGEPAIILHPDGATAAVRRFRGYIESPLLTGISVDFGELDVYDQIPETIPDLLAERPLIVFGKWRGNLEGRITVSGYGGEGRFQRDVTVPSDPEGTGNPALRYLWARHRIAELGDYGAIAPDGERAREIAALGLTYDLLTAYTSFVAVDTEVVNAGGRPDEVKQPLPLPQGVPNSAVGGGVPIAPEPEINALIATLAGLGIWTLLRRRRAGMVAR